MHSFISLCEFTPSASVTVGSDSDSFDFLGSVWTIKSKEDDKWVVKIKKNRCRKSCVQNLWLAVFSSASVSNCGDGQGTFLDTEKKRKISTSEEKVLITRVLIHEHNSALAQGLCLAVRRCTGWKTCLSAPFLGQTCRGTRQRREAVRQSHRWTREARPPQADVLPTLSSRCSSWESAWSASTARRTRRPSIRTACCQSLASRRAGRGLSREWR